MDSVIFSAEHIRPNMLYERRKRYFQTILFLCSSFYYFGTIGKNVSDGLGILLIPFVILLSYIIFYKNTIFEIKNLVIAFVTIILVWTSYFFVGGGLGSVANNLSAILFVIIYYKLKFSLLDFRYFATLSFLLQVYLALYCFSNGLNYGYIGIYNSNTIGLQILLNLIFINMYIAHGRKWLLAIINIFSVLLIFYIKSRTSLVAGLIIIVFLLFNSRVLIKPWLMKLSYWLLIFMGIYFPVMYTNLSQNYDSFVMHFQNIGSLSLQFFDKNLFTGREYMWAEAISQLTANKTNFLLGIGSHYFTEIGRNFHSSYLTVFICGGFLTYFFFSLLLYRFYKKGNFATFSIQRSRLLYFAFMVVGLTESVVFSGHFAVMAYLLLCYTDNIIIKKDIIRS